MKPDKPAPASKQDVSKHPGPLGSQQGVSEKAAGAAASVKARVDSKNMPDKPALHRQNTPNSSGRK